MLDGQQHIQIAQLQHMTHKNQPSSSRRIDQLPIVTIQAFRHSYLIPFSLLQSAFLLLQKSGYDLKHKLNHKHPKP
jgi:hypothetical protein